jgi:hypothetical protein
MSVPDSFQVVLEGLLVETGASTGAYAEPPNLQLKSHCPAVSVLVAGRNIVGSPLSLFVQERVVPHTISVPEYIDDASHHDRCWVTIITSPSFVLGAIALGHSLNPNDSSSAAIKIALVTAHVPFVDRCILSAAGWQLSNVSTISNPNTGFVDHFSNVYSKLHVFGLGRTCGRVVYLDADVVAVDVCP